MTWNRISKYAIQSGDYTISKALVNGSARYTLWEGDEMVAIFESAREAKERAEAMTEKEVESVA